MRAAQLVGPSLTTATHLVNAAHDEDVVAVCSHIKVRQAEQSTCNLMLRGLQERVRRRERKTEKGFLKGVRDVVVGVRPPPSPETHLLCAQPGTALLPGLDQRRTSLRRAFAQQCRTERGCKRKARSKASRAVHGREAGTNLIRRRK